MSALPATLRLGAAGPPPVICFLERFYLSLWGCQARHEGKAQETADRRAAAGSTPTVCKNPARPRGRKIGQRVCAEIRTTMSTRRISVPAGGSGSPLTVSSRAEMSCSRPVEFTEEMMMVAQIGVEIGASRLDDDLLQQPGFDELVEGVVHGRQRDRHRRDRCLVVELFGGDMPIAIFQQQLRQDEALTGRPQAAGAKARQCIERFLIRHAIDNTGFCRKKETIASHDANAPQSPVCNRSTNFRTDGT